MSLCGSVSNTLLLDWKCARFLRGQLACAVPLITTLPETIPLLSGLTPSLRRGLSL